MTPFAAPDLKLETIKRANGAVITRGTYKDRVISKALIASGGARCIILLDSYGSLDHGAFRNLFCIGRDGQIVWSAPLPETHDRFVDIRLGLEGVLANSPSGYLVIFEIETGRVIDQVFVK